VSVTVDMSKFQDTFKRYALVTSRDMATALNGKHRDIMFNSVVYGPNFNTEHSAEDYARNRRPEYITFKTIKKHGENAPGSSKARRVRASGRAYKRKGSFKGPGQVWGMVERNEVARKLRKRHSGARGYMASAFIKAGLKFAPAASKKGKPKQRYFENTTSGRVTQATAENLVSTAVLNWNARSTADANQKQALATQALRAGVREIVRDMEEYMVKKMRKAAR